MANDTVTITVAFIFTVFARIDVISDLYSRAKGKVVWAGNDAESGTFSGCCRVGRIIRLTRSRVVERHLSGEFPVNSAHVLGDHAHLGDVDLIFIDTRLRFAVPRGKQ